MSAIDDMLHEQYTEYSIELAKLEAEMRRKHDAGEDFREEAKKAAGIKRLMDACKQMEEKEDTK